MAMIKSVSKMRIGIVGAGRIGGNLARRLVAAGQEVQRRTEAVARARALGLL